jgi:hypothetical protein
MDSGLDGVGRGSLVVTGHEERNEDVCVGGRGCEWKSLANPRSGWDVTVLWMSRLDLPEKGFQGPAGQVGVNPSGGWKLDEKHRFVVPAPRSCVTGERLAIQIFRRVAAVGWHRRSDVP